MASQVVVPSPNLNVKVSESALTCKANLWTRVLNERSQPFGVRKHKFDYDLPREIAASNSNDHAAGGKFLKTNHNNSDYGASHHQNALPVGTIVVNPRFG